MPDRIPLVLVPGMLCDRELWAYQTGDLASIADMTVTEDHTVYDSMSRIAEATVAAAPPSFALAGLSMGGYIALEIVRKWPERVERLALLDTSPFQDTDEQRVRRFHTIDLARQGRFDEVVSLLMPLALHPDRLTDRELVNRISAMYHRAGPEIFIRQQQAIMGRTDQVSCLSRISCPVVVICGKQDLLTPLVCSETMSREIRNSRLIALDECGHMSSMEKPEK